MSREGVGQNCAVSQTLLPRRRDDRNAILFAALHESGFGPFRPRLLRVVVSVIGAIAAAPVCCRRGRK